MLPKQNRANKKEIEEIFRSGTFVNSPHLTLKFIQHKGSLEKKLSFIAPKTVVKSAVKRNLLRRRGYVALSRLMQVVPLGITGAFIYSKKSFGVFGQTTKIAKNQSKLDLQAEIELIVSKIR